MVKITQKRLNGLVINALMLGFQNKLQKIDSEIIIMAKKRIRFTKLKELCEKTHSFKLCKLFCKKLFTFICKSIAKNVKKFVQLSFFDKRN